VPIIFHPKAYVICSICFVGWCHNCYFIVFISVYQLVMTGPRINYYYWQCLLFALISLFKLLSTRLCFQWEKFQLSRQQRTRSLRPAGTQCSCTTLVPGSQTVWPRSDSLRSSWFSSIYSDMSKPAMTACFRKINMSKNSKFYSSVIWRFIFSAAQHVRVPTQLTIECEIFEIFPDVW